MRRETLVYSRRIFDTITSVHQSRECGIKKTVAQIHDWLEAGELNGVVWMITVRTTW